jgi:hypothetical protein
MAPQPIEIARNGLGNGPRRFAVAGGELSVSLGWIDEVHAVDAAGVEAALKSAAVTQSVEDPVADENERRHRKERDDIGELLPLVTVVQLDAFRRIEPIKLEFLRSILRQLPTPSFALGDGQLSSL